MIDYETYCKIKDCHERQHLTIAQTARALGLHADTVTKWAQRAQYRARHSVPRRSQLDPFKARVVRLLEAHAYSAQQIFQRLREEERAVWRLSTNWLSACTKCALKTRCTTSPYRRIARWEHEHILDRMLERLKRTPDASRIRRRTVEHVFGTLKAWMGSTHFLTKTLPRVSTEMSLHVLAYNLKRMLEIFGVQPLIRAMTG